MSFAEMQVDSPIPPRNIVVFGGSYGGVSTAHYLLKHAIPRLPEPDTYKLIMISTASKALCRPACPRALISEDMFPQEKLFTDVAGAFEQYPAGSFQFIQGTAVKLDHVNRDVRIMTAKSQEAMKIEFHALVIATGAATVSPLLGLNGDEEALKTNWTTFRNALPSAKIIVVAGGGPAGIETAGELGEYLNGRPARFGSNASNSKVKIIVVTAGRQILPVLREAIAQKAEAYLKNIGVEVWKNLKVERVVPANAGTDDIIGKATVELEDGRTLDADLYIPATGTRPNTGFVDEALLVADGRMKTDPTTLRVDEAGPRVYAIGDAASYARPGIHLIMEAVPVLCANVKRDLLLAVGESSDEDDREYKEDERETQLVPIGSSRGVGAAMGYQLPSWTVWLIKGRDYWLWTVGRLWSGRQWAKAS